MDVTSLISTIVPIGIVAFIYGLTEVIKSYQAKGMFPNLSLIAVPFVAGLLAGFLHYFTTTPSESLAVLTVAKRILLALEQGLGYGGASVILWEVRKVFFKGKDGTDLDKGT